MAVADRDRQLEADLQASRQQDARKVLILASVIGLMSLASAVSNLSDLMAGSVPGTGRALVGALGVAAAVLMWRQPRSGWLVAMAWALVQIPFYAWTPDGSATAQALQIPLTMTSRSSVNGQLVSYTSVGVNLVGVIFVVWLRLWKEKFGR